MKSVVKNPAAAWTVLLATVYAFLLSAACLNKLQNHAYTDFDLAHHAQSLYSILRGGGECSMLGIPFLGNHMALILYAIAPFAALVPAAALLVCVQSAVLASGAWAVFALGRRRLSPRAAAGAATLYLVYPPLVSMNLFEFHPVALSTAFLAFTLYAYDAERLRLFAVFLTLATLTQENVALIAAGFGALALIQRRRARWWAPPLLGGVAYFVLVVFVIMPRLNPGVIQFASLYSEFGDTLPSALVGMAASPLRTLSVMLEPHKLAFAGMLLAPLAYLSLLSPSVWIPLTPVILQRFLSNRASEFVVHFHYQAEFIPFIFAAALHGLAAFKQRRFRVVAMGMAVAFTLMACVALPSWPDLAQALAPATATEREARRLRTEFMAALPPDARIAATFGLLAPLARRRHVHSFHHLYGGTYTLSSKAYPTPDLDFILYDTLDPLTFGKHGFFHPYNYRRFDAVWEQGQWEIAAQAETFVALQRRAGPPAKPSLLQARLDLSQEAAAPSGAPPLASANGLDLLFVRLGTPGVGRYANSVPAELHWRRTGGPPADAPLTLELFDGARRLYKGQLVPGRRFFPPMDWQPGVTYSEHRILLFESDIEPAAYPRATLR